MSELFCPATLVLARHGEAEYECVGLSDDGGSLTGSGRRQARELAEGLAGDRVAAVWCSDLSRSVQTAEIAAAALGLTTVTVASGLREVSVGAHRGTPVRAGVLAAELRAWQDGRLSCRVPGGESGDEVVARLRGALEGAADQYRGETVLVVSHGWAIRVAVTQLCVNAAGAGSWDLDPGQTAWVSAGTEDWRLRSWAGRPVAAD
jgi:probable phosphoglycerate mutase